jgi:hypothetical protein
MSTASHFEPEPANSPESEVATVVRTTIEVELSTAEGYVFRGTVSAVYVRMIDGGAEINSPIETYYNLSKLAELDLRMGSHLETFRVENALASFRDGKLTVLATAILPRFSGIAG